jgi:hypothetical protein
MLVFKEPVLCPSHITQTAVKANSPQITNTTNIFFVILAKINSLCAAKIENRSPTLSNTKLQDTQRRMKQIKQQENISLSRRYMMEFTLNAN